MGFWNGGFMTKVGGPAISTGLGMLGGMFGSRSQYKNQKKLMAIQLRNQQMLNQQGHDLQMDMWNKTNYGAQVKHMEDAGINPGLLYGQSGAGGSTTGSQGGGSAASGNAASFQAMDLQNALVGAQISKLISEKNNIDQDTKNKGSENDLIQANTGNVEADTILKNLNSEAQKIMNEIATNTKEWQIGKVNEEFKLIYEQAEQLKISNKIQRETTGAQILKANLEASQVGLQNSLIEAQTSLSKKQIEEADARIKKITNDMQVDWFNAETGRMNISVQEARNRIMKRKNEVDVYLGEIGVNEQVRNNTTNNWINGVNTALDFLENFITKKNMNINLGL